MWKKSIFLLHLITDVRFPELTKEEIGNLLSIRLSKNTKIAITQSIGVFTQYCYEQNTTLNEVENMSPNDLDALLSRFFAEVRKADGQLHSRNALLMIRYGLQKHFIKNGFDINDKQIFTSSNMFSAVLVNCFSTDNYLWKSSSIFSN